MPNGEATGFEVDVLPAEAEDFAAAHAGHGGQVERSFEMVAADVNQELGQLVGIPDLHLPLATDPRFGWACPVGRVALQEATVYRVGQHLVQGGMHVAHRLRGQAAAGSGLLA